jgi:hypothetical protein
VSQTPPLSVASSLSDLASPLLAEGEAPAIENRAITTAVPRDGRTTWQHSAIPLPAGFDQGAANPIAKFDDQARVFVNFMAATFLGPQPPLTNPDFLYSRSAAKPATPVRAPGSSAVTRERRHPSRIAA